jgi:RHH-type proline utilization regulon transcriptional repressor/proline dehydrogenase/delta 1-pyrroline-5-carboxylate dehydrogenase
MPAWDQLDDVKYQDEAQAAAALLALAPLSADERLAARDEATALVRAARQLARRKGIVESVLAQYPISTGEGLALMRLAEALLRTPDVATRDRLIAESVASGDWASHVGRSDSVLVNLSTRGLMLSGGLLAAGDEAGADLAGDLRRLAVRLGEPVIRAAVGQAMRLMGEQFVLGHDMKTALARARAEGLLCSFDRLGEGARTAADAQAYEQAYAEAIEAVGQDAAGAGPEAGHGVSVKLSALSPRYEATQEARVWDELYPRLLRLARAAARYDLNFTLDAEEADRLVLSLKLLDRLAREPALGAWRGLGLAVQAYQKRAPRVIALLSALARDSGRRLMVRLVKGAYWDGEIKRAQVQGRPDYPVYTTKAATDLSYLCCARALIAAAPGLYAQFATHNAHSLAAVRRMAKAAGIKVEFQRLHGMGEPLYRAAGALDPDLAARAYAPVGDHERLLPYLVRRLLENGANSSFVHLLLDESTPPEAVAADPMTVVEAAGPGRHPRIPPPPDLYGDRRNSAGIDLSTRRERERLTAAVAAFAPFGEGPVAIRSPADRSRLVGHVTEATPAAIDAAFAAARRAQPAWDAAGGARRAVVLRAMADALEADRDALIALCALEAGKTLADGVAEVREAADFCRYYARLAETRFGEPETLRGPAGETNSLALHGRGVFVCISPWNFPLAIFTGQVSAALAAGNAVVAKPAEQTPLIATRAVGLFHAAGLDPGLLALAPGDGEGVGQALIAHPACDGVAFTGGTDTARRINQALAARPGPILPLIAETGGLNGLFADTTALREQLVDDVIVSAFGSAGQRCSALRILFLPHETADELIAAIKGAMGALVVGDPADPATDVGPIIDEDARRVLEAHVARLEREARILRRLAAPAGGCFFGPALAEIPSAAFLETEVFGPVLHVVRYDVARLSEAAGALAASRFGLTLGVHSRLPSFAEAVRRRVPAGNVYVNRSIIGAVVGVQPFGGEGLSGTGPKAGGPNTLIRYAVERALSVNTSAQGGDPALLNLSEG